MPLETLYVTRYPKRSNVVLRIVVASGRPAPVIP